MSKHTPGPWVAKPQPGQTVGVHTYTHCVMYGDDSIADTLTESDARLIAAAPELLAALKETLAYAMQQPGTPNCIIRAEAAIARAEGRAT